MPFLTRIFGTKPTKNSTPLDQPKAADKDSPKTDEDVLKTLKNEGIHSLIGRCTESILASGLKVPNGASLPSSNEEEKGDGASLAFLSHADVITPGFSPSYLASIINNSDVTKKIQDKIMTVLVSTFLSQTVDVEPKNIITQFKDWLNKLGFSEENMESKKEKKSFFQLSSDYSFNELLDKFQITQGKIHQGKTTYEMKVDTQIFRVVYGDKGENGKPQIIFEIPFKSRNFRPFFERKNRAFLFKNMINNVKEKRLKYARNATSVAELLAAPDSSLKPADSNVPGMKGFYKELNNMIFDAYDTTSNSEIANLAGNTLGEKHVVNGLRMLILYTFLSTKSIDERNEILDKLKSSDKSALLTELKKWLIDALGKNNGDLIFANLNTRYIGSFLESITVSEKKDILLGDYSFNINSIDNFEPTATSHGNDTVAGSVNDKDSKSNKSLSKANSGTTLPLHSPDASIFTQTPENISPHNETEIELMETSYAANSIFEDDEEVFLPPDYDHEREARQVDHPEVNGSAVLPIPSPFTQTPKKISTHKEKEIELMEMSNDLNAGELLGGGEISEESEESRQRPLQRFQEAIRNQYQYEQIQKAYNQPSYTLNASNKKIEPRTNRGQFPTNQTSEAKNYTSDGNRFNKSVAGSSVEASKLTIPSDDKSGAFIISTAKPQTTPASSSQIPNTVAGCFNSFLSFYSDINKIGKGSVAFDENLFTIYRNILVQFQDYLNELTKDDKKKPSAIEFVDELIEFFNSQLYIKQNLTKAIVASMLTRLKSLIIPTGIARDFFKDFLQKAEKEGAPFLAEIIPK